jgi:electron transport complex protein RnfB
MIPEVYYELGARLNEFAYKVPLLDDYLLILQEVFTPEEARIAIQLPGRPAPLSELAAKIGMAESGLSEILERMAHKGTVFTCDREGQTEYCAIPFVPGIVEFQLMRAEGSPREKKLAAMLEAFEEKMAPFMTPEMVEQFQEMIGDPFARVIPIQEEVQSVTEIHPYEKISEFIDKEDFFAAAKCYCRHHTDLMGRECKAKGVPEYSCMSFGDVARFVVKHGYGKKITREEARRILDECEKAGLVHCTNNVSNMMTFICNCCGCCCGILRMLVKYQNPRAVAQANFVVQATVEDCTGCGDCLERCQVRALTLDNEVVQIDSSRCIGCGLCSTTCPTGCLALVRRETIVEPRLAGDPFVGILEG